MTLPAQADGQHDLLIRQAAAMRLAGRHEEALRLAGQVLVDAPGDVAASWEVAVALGELGRYDEATSVASQAVQAFPESDGAWRLMAAQLAAMRRTTEAINAATRAIQLNPLSADNRAAASLALTYSPRRADRKLAVVQAEEMLRLDPNNPGCHEIHGEVLRRCGRLRQAERAYQQALRLDPGHVEARYGLGLVHDERGHMLRAYRAYAPIVAEQPDAHPISTSLEGATAKWAGLMAFNGVSMSWMLVLCALQLIDPSSPHIAATYRTLMIGLAGLALLVVVSVVVRGLRDRRLARFTWSRQRLDVLAGLVGTVTVFLGVSLMSLVPPSVVVMIGVVGGITVIVLAIRGRRARRRARDRHSAMV